MYTIGTSLIGAWAIALSLPHLDGGYLFLALAIFGGMCLGHVLTEALNDPED